MMSFTLDGSSFDRCISSIVDDASLYVHMTVYAADYNAFNL